MSASVKAIVLLVVAGLVGCTGGVAVEGEGDVLSQSGAYNCYLEHSPCEYDNAYALSEKFTAVPRDGWEFEGWRYCQESTGPVCEVDVSAEVVREVWGKTLPPLTAIFKRSDVEITNLELIVTACDSDDLPYDRHCALLIGREIRLNTTANTLDAVQFDHLPYQGKFTSLEDGWSFSGEYLEFSKSVHSMSATRIGNTVILDKRVSATDGADVHYYFKLITKVL